MCCPSEVPYPLSCVLQLVRGRASSRIPVAPGLALSPAAGGKGEKKENVFFLTHATTSQGLVLLLYTSCPLPCAPANRSALLCCPGDVPHSPKCSSQ